MSDTPCARLRTTGRTWTRRAFAAIAALLLLTAGPVLSDEAPVEIETQTDRQETRYCVRSGDCRLCWDAMLQDPHPAIAANRSRCARPLQAQTAEMTRLLQTILARNPEAGFKTLFWGRLTPDAPHDDLIMSQRLCLAAFGSARWNRQTGKPVAGDINAFVRDIANTASIYPELERIFADCGKTVAVSDVEKVLVLPAAKLPFFEELKAQGVSAGDKLPFDAMVWFHISDH